MTTKQRLKVGVAGGGLIAQVEHIPNLLALGDRFEVVAVSDPSPAVRAGLPAALAWPASPMQPISSRWGWMRS